MISNKPLTHLSTIQVVLYKWGKELALAGGAIAIAVGGVLVKKKIDINKAKELEEQARKIAEEQAEKHRQKMLKLAEEARIAQDAKKAEAAKRAEERARLKAEKEAKAKAEQAAKEAQLKIRNANNATKRSIEEKFSELDVMRNLENKLKADHPGATYSEIDDLMHSHEGNMYLYDFEANIDKLSPKEFLNSYVVALTENGKAGGNISVKDVKTILAEQTDDIKRTKRFIEDSSIYKKYDYSAKFNKFSDYFDEVSKELDNIKPKDGENIGDVVSRAVKSVEDKKAAFSKHRQNVYQTAQRSYAEQVAPIKERLVYSESPDKIPAVELSVEEKKALADELNEICRLKGDRMLTPESSIDHSAYIWKEKYVSGYTPALDQRTERAILDTFPRYKAPDLKGNGEFKYKPVYRFMHIEDTESFLKQFDEIDGVYTPGKLQSCTKYKHYGETYPSGMPRFTFSDLNPEQNVKFIIHPKSEVSKAAEIGEGKYGNTEVIYSGDSQFRILGKVKKTVTPEEMKEAFGSNIKDFEDFDRWEIHLQEM